MDFKDYIKQIGDRVVKLKDQIQTEEATKNAFIMPFLQASLNLTVLSRFSKKTPQLEISTFFIKFCLWL